MGKDLKLIEQTFFFCDGGSCQKAGSEKVIREARAYLMNEGLWKKTHTIKTRCNGRCEDAPTCIVDGKYWYKKLTAKKIVALLDSHISKNEPVVDSLLYQPGWNKIMSEKNIFPGQAKNFQLEDDPELGPVYMAKGFSSDQYLFPLFSFLFQQKQSAFVCSENTTVYPFQEAKIVTYDHSNSMCLSFNNGKTVNLIIGSVTKETKQEDILRKITKTEYYIKLSQSEKGIRFKNKMGDVIGFIPLDEKNQVIWDYCLEIQLNNATEPELYKTNV